MATSAKLYGAFLGKLLNKEIDFDSDTLKVMLCTSSYTPDQDAHDYKDDVTNEISGTGYTAGGATLASVSAGYTSGTNTWKLDANDSSWTSATFAGAKWAVIYDDTPSTAATKPLIAYADLDGNHAVTNGTFTIQWDAAGIATLTVS